MVIRLAYSGKSSPQFFSLAMTASLQFPFPDLPAPGTRLQVAPGIFWLRMPLPFALDHINLWLLKDGEGWVIVDTGFGLPDVQATWETILAGLGGPVTAIVVTHFHPDHLGLASWLQEKTGAAPLYMTAGEYLTAHAVWHEVGGHGTAAMLAQFRAHGLEEERCAALAKRGNAYRKGVPGLPETYRRLFGGDRLQIDGQDWQVVLGYGHSPEHMALYCEDSNVLISGDMLLPKISTNVSVFAVTPTANVLQHYLQSLARYAEVFPPDTLVLPSHGLPFRGIQPRVAELHEHHDERLAVLEENCAQPRSAAELLTTLFPRALDTHQTMFAMGEAIAHLNYLEQAGRLARKRDADGVFRYVRNETKHP